MNDILDEIEKPNNKKRIFLMRYLIGFLYDGKYAGIPYQDPPLELLKKYNYHRSIADTITDSGFKIVILGIVGGVVRKIIQFLKIKFL